jgi:preprotein translocase subunit SecA
MVSRAQFNGEIWDYAREDAPEIFEPLKALATMERDADGWDDACRELGASLVVIRDYFRAGNWRRAFEEVQKPFVREGPKIGRNDPCPCGSGRKFKKCCGMTGGAVH